jgi:hypothetical protein
MKYDAMIEVRFRVAKEGGRQNDIKTDYYSCPVRIDGEYYDCRIFLNNITITLGETYILPIKFLDRQLALPNLSPEKRITLWEGKDIADGIIKEIY